MIGHRKRLPTWILTLAILSTLAPELAGSQETQTILPDSVSVRRANCADSCWEWLTRLLFGPTVTKDSAAFLLANWGSEELTVTGILMVARGDVSESFWVQSYDSLDLETLAPLETEQIGLDLSSVIGKRPDRYAGEVRLRASGIEDSLRTPLFIYVRRGPGLVILTLLIGFLVGRFVIRINESGGTSGSTESRKTRYVAGRLAGFRWNKGSPGFWTGVAALLTGVAWAENGSKQIKFRARVGVSWVLIALAVYEGLRLLYLNDLTFGDNGIFDYAAVFAWAAAADSGQRYLTNFKWSPQGGREGSPPLP